jgi:hypothetical protein
MPGSEWSSFCENGSIPASFRNRPTSGGRLYTSEARTNDLFSAPTSTLFTSWSVYPLRCTRTLTARVLVHRTPAPPSENRVPFHPTVSLLKCPPCWSTVSDCAHKSAHHARAEPEVGGVAPPSAAITGWEPGGELTGSVCPACRSPSYDVLLRCCP